MKQKRFNKTCYPTVHFSNEILVECPQCFEKGLVRTKLPKYTLPFPRGYKATFSCKSCAYQVTENDERNGSDSKEWFGYMQGYVNQSCGYCGGKSIIYWTKPTRDIFESITIPCDGCKRERAYTLQWYRYRGEKPIDPYCGFNLYIQINIKGNILWAYNLEHLEYIQEYVEAELRSDHDRHKYSIIFNLPKWVVARKNRDLIVKKINQFKENLK